MNRDDVSTIMYKVKTITLLMLCLVMFLPSAFASEPIVQQICLVQYGESSLLFVDSNDEKTDITLCSLFDQSAIPQWTLTLEHGQIESGFSVFSLPGISRIAHLTSDRLVIISGSDELVEQVALSEADKWGNPIYAHGQSAIALFNRDGSKLLVITDQGVEIRELIDSTLDAQMVLLNREGVAYQGWREGQLYFRCDKTGECTAHVIDGELAYVDEVGFWTLDGSALRMPNGSTIQLPDPNGQYVVNRAMPDGIIISDVSSTQPQDPMDWGNDTPISSLLVSTDDAEYGLWANQDVSNCHYLSANMKYCLTEGDWIDDTPPSWDVWSRDNGTASYPQKHRLLNKDGYTFDRTPLVFDDGRAIFLGEGDGDAPWQLWCLDLADGTYTGINCTGLR